MDLPGGTPTRLTDSDEDEFMPAWSPDGNKIVFVNRGQGNYIYVMNADGSDVVSLGELKYSK